MIKPLMIAFILFSGTSFAQDTIIQKAFLGIPFIESLDKQLEYIKQSGRFNQILSKSFPIKTIYRTALLGGPTLDKETDSIIVGIIISKDSFIENKSSYKILRTFVEYFYTDAVSKNKEYENLITAINHTYNNLEQVEYGNKTTSIEERFIGYEFYLNEKNFYPKIGVLKGATDQINSVLMEFIRLYDN